MMQFRQALERIWWGGVDEVAGHGATLHAIESLDLPKPDRIIAVGKAATHMLEAALSWAGHDTRSLLVTKYDHVVCRHPFNQPKLEEYQGDGTLTVMESAHPVPDENSIKAGQAIKAFVENASADDSVLFLLSGGASSLAEFLQPPVDLKTLREMTQGWLAEGLSIDQINAKRKAYSLIKGGKLWEQFKGKRLDVLAISDVPGDDIAMIGSGIGQVTRKDLAHGIHIIASNTKARNGAQKKAAMLGFDVVENSCCLDNDVELVAQMLAQKLKKGRPGVYVFGGEPTVTLPDNPGKGGRNQQLALQLAKHLQGVDTIEVLVAGTDGTDGPTDAAGGYSHAMLFGEGGELALQKADCNGYLQQHDCLFVTGPTGTNVMDLVVAIKQ